MAELGLDSEFSFGKHEGHQVEDVIEDDPKYMEWLVDNSVVELDEEVLEVLARKGIA